MNTEGMKEASYCFRLFLSRHWFSLIPDLGDRIIRKGKGIYGTRSAVCAARTDDSSTFIAYLPVGNGVEIQLSKMGRTPVKGWWFNPRTGHCFEIGSFKTKGFHEFTPPSVKDWVLVLDRQSKHFPAPGSVQN